MFRIFVLLFVGLALAGCQTGPSTAESKTTSQKFKKSETEPLLVDSAFATLSAIEWMAESDMPLVLDRHMSASEVSYVLRKTGFEPSPAEISPWIGQNRSNLIKYLINGLDASPVIEFPEWTEFEPRYWGHSDWSDNKRNAFRSARRQEIAELRQWWIRQMLATNSPLAERVVLFWENTFVSGFSDLEEKSHAQWMHHKTIRTHALGNYQEFLQAIVKDPAILIYLDNNENKRDSPNENLARELLEIFTLGEGNYSENDVRESARALAGWHVSEFGEIGFIEKAWARDFSQKKIFGEKKNFDGEKLVELILRHPKAAEFVVKRLWSEFISLEPIPEEALLHWSDAFRKMNYEISELLAVILNSSYFWEEKYRGTSVKSPSELLVGAVRMSQNTELSVSELDAALADMGQTLFDPPDVSGWGYGDYWIDAAKLIERERFQARISEVLTSEGMTDVAPKNAMEFEMVKQQGPNAMRIKLAGEAYKGPPPLRVSIKYPGGFWSSDIFYLKSARDTERLGRYKDESQWVWETISIELPGEINSIETVGIKFTSDAAGNGGDRNLFVGAVEWQGQTIPGYLGVQSPGCKSDKAGKERHPDRLYCAGQLKLDWTELSDQITRGHSNVAMQSQFETNELVLLWLKSPNKGGWQSIDLMFDGLSFKDRTWDYFGFKLVVDTKNNSHFQLVFDEDRCKPSCFTRWPSGAWTDKLGLRHSIVSFNNFEDWAQRQFSALRTIDKELVKAIISTMPRVREMVASTQIHREPDSKKIWLERMDKFLKFASNNRWRLKKSSKLVERNVGSIDDTNTTLIMDSMMSGLTIADEEYQLASGYAISAEKWHEKLETYLKLASEPLESWMLSYYEGERLTDLRQVITSPYMNIK